MYFLVGFRVLLIVVMVLLVRGSRLESGGIVLPEPQADTAAVGEEGTETRLNVVAISPDTVRPAINTLARSLLYSRAQTVETFWSGGSGQTVYQVYVSGGRTRIDTQLPGGSVRHTLCSGGSAAVWYDDDTAWTVLRSSELTADRLQRMPTYELVRDLEVDTIAAAGYLDRDGTSCIYVETYPDEAGYVGRYWVAVDTGLLYAAERTCDDTLVYRFTAAPLDTEPPAEALFLLPDGSVLE